MSEAAATPLDALVAQTERLPPGIFMSPAIDKLAAALSKAQGQMKPASKESFNPHFKSSYADLAAVWEACRAPLSENGLSVVQLPRADGRRVTLVYVLLHSSGQFVGSDLTVTATQDSPQGVGGAITYARRYTQAAIAGVAQDDDDGNDASAGNDQPGAEFYDNGNAVHRKDFAAIARAERVPDKDYPRLAQACIGREMRTLPAFVKEWLSANVGKGTPS